MRRVALLLVLLIVLGGCGLSDTSSSSTLSASNVLTPTPASSANEVAVLQRRTPTIGPVMHVVEAGETLWDISLKYGIRMEDIQEANNISDPNRIEAGQELLIPLAPLPGPVNAATAEAIATFTPIVDSPFEFKAWVKTLTPFVTGKETVYAKLTSYDVGVRGAQMYAVVHFESGDERLTAGKTSDGSGTASIEFPVKKGKRGQTVLVDVYLDTPDRTFRAKTAFVPK